MRSSSWSASGWPTSTFRRTNLDTPDYVRNDPNRCFHCKDELFTRLADVGHERGYQHIIYGVNLRWMIWATTGRARNAAKKNMKWRGAPGGCAPHEG